MLPTSMSDFFSYINSTPTPLPGTEWKRRPGMMVSHKMRYKAAAWNENGFSEVWVRVVAKPGIKDSSVGHEKMAFRFFDAEPTKGDHLIALTLYLGTGEALERWLLWAEFKEVKQGELDYNGEDTEWTVEADIKVLRYDSFAKYK